jgi:hypothetical protein
MTPAQCRLKILDYWTVQSHLQGLAITQTECGIDERFFSCCQGTGNLCSPGASGYADVCDLIARRSQLLQVLKDVIALYDIKPDGRPNLQELLCQAGHQNLARLQIQELRNSFFEMRGKSKKGTRLRYETPVQSTGPGLGSISLQDAIIIGFASSLIWHQGIRTRFLSPRRSSFDQNQLLDDIRQDRGRNFCFLTELPSDMTHSGPMQMFEHIVSLASQMQMPIWILSSERPNESSVQGAANSEKPRPGVRNFNLALKQKIQITKTNTSELSLQCRSRLSELCNYT